MMTMMRTMKVTRYNSCKLIENSQSPRNIPSKTAIFVGLTLAGLLTSASVLMMKVDMLSMNQILQPSTMNLVPLLCQFHHLLLIAWVILRHRSSLFRGLAVGLRQQRTSSYRLLRLLWLILITLEMRGSPVHMYIHFKRIMVTYPLKLVEKCFIFPKGLFQSIMTIESQFMLMMRHYNNEIIH